MSTWNDYGRAKQQYDVRQGSNIWDLSKEIMEQRSHLENVHTAFELNKS